VGTQVRVTQGIFIGNEGKVILADLDRNRWVAPRPLLRIFVRTSLCLVPGASIRSRSHARFRRSLRRGGDTMGGRFLVRMDVFSKETPTEFAPEQLELLHVQEDVGPEVDEAVEQVARWRCGKRYAWLLE